jgi:DNA-binding CsgD family transcriptional regulator
VEIFGREQEQARLTGLFEALPDQGGALALRGEAGVGKSTLLGWAAGEAARRGCRVLAVAGVQAEFDIAYAGLDQLVRQVPADDSTEAARRTVLAAVDAEGPPLRPVRVALALLEVFTAAAAGSPVLVTADDAQWLDAPSWAALSFVARRLQTDPVLLLTALRDGDEADARLAHGSTGEVRLERLAPEPAAALLDHRAPHLRSDLRAQVLAEAAGNPLGLVELAAVAVRSGPVALLPSSLPLTTRLEQTFARTGSGLPPATRVLLLVAALDDGAAVDEIVAAADRLEPPVTADDLGPAVAADLITIDEPLQVRFRHPLIRSALRQQAGVARRRTVHAVLADVLANQPDRRLWHRAEAATGPDEQLASELTTAGTAARRRGAVRTALAALERAAQLSEQPQEQASRLLRAAETAHELGDIDTVLRLLQDLENRTLRGPEEARFAWMREIFLTAGWSGASRMPAFVEIIDRMRKDGDIGLALDSLVTVSLRCWWSNPDRATRDLIVDAVERLGALPLDPRLVSVLALVAPLEQGALALGRIEQLSTRLSGNPEELELLATGASAVGALPLSIMFSTASVTGLRAQGRMGTLTQALHGQATVAAHLGDVRLAMAAATEARALALETGQPRWALTADLARGLAEALRGNGGTARALADAAEGALLPIGAHPLLALVQLVRGAGELAEGNYAAAYEHLRRITDPAELPYHPVVRFWALAHLAEAAAGSGRSADLRALVAELTPLLDVTGSPVLRVGLDYCAAVLGDDDDAFVRALAGPHLSAWPFERARLLHAYGAWLRRQRRVAESRPQLRAAVEAFEALGTTAWAERSRAELRAAGERVRHRPDARDGLTPQELQIAELAAAGLSNRDIGERLFLSHRTISTHLYRIFPKLGIRSRNELGRALQPGSPSDDV